MFRHQNTHVAWCRCLSTAIIGEVKEWWEFFSEGFPETADLSVGFNRG